MLVFVVPLKSRRVAKSWDYVTRLFERCLRSICSQTSPDFKVIVVCHKKPAIESDHPAVTYPTVDFPVPDANHHLSQNLDKYRKRAAGYLHAGRFKPSHVMQVDADDCISNRLADFVSQNPRGRGWFFDSGYFYRDGTRRIYLKPEGFHYWCGSSFILGYDMLNLPKSADFDDSAFPLLAPSYIKRRAEESGAPLAPLPFPGAVYVRYTKSGEGTHNRRTFFSNLRMRPRTFLHRAKLRLLQLTDSEPIGASVSAEFGLHPPPTETNRDAI
jgi:hypothetical protein